jgi:hypoxanthine phosphoribosyltransferase
MSIDIDDVEKVYSEAECLFNREQVEAAMARMARLITADMRESNPLVLTVMSGGLIPAGYLLSHLDFPLQIDYIHASRYRGTTSGGELEWRVTPRFMPEGRNVLIVDDILDEGLTLQAIVDSCRNAGAASVKSAVLVKKRHARNIGVEADYVGLEVEDRYVFGFGMDYHEYLRNAPGIYAVKGS